MSILDDDEILFQEFNTLPMARQYFKEHYSNQMYDDLEKDAKFGSGRWYVDEKQIVHLAPRYALIYKASSYKETITGGLFVIDDNCEIIIDAKNKKLKSFEGLPHDMKELTIIHHKGNISWETFPENFKAKRLYIRNCSMTTMEGCKVNCDELLLIYCQKLQDTKGFPQNLSYCGINRCSLSDLHGISLCKDAILDIGNLSKLTSLNGLVASSLKKLHIINCNNIHDWSNFPKFINYVDIRRIYT